MPRFNLVVLSNPVEGREDEFNSWYTGTHLADVLRVPGIVGAQRFEIAGAQSKDMAQPWRYLAVYECEADDAQQIVDGLRARSGTPEMPLSSAMDPSNYVGLFEAITEQKRSARG